MVQQARTTHAGVAFVCADAQQLPFTSGAFDLVTARHMLYHVPDLPRALAEMRRMLRPGGQFLAVTNAKGYMAEHRRAVAEAIDAAGAEVAAPFAKVIATASSASFTEGNGADAIRAVFGAVRMEMLEASLVFHDAAPVVAYFNSTRSMKGVPCEVWERVARELEKVVARHLANGPWRVSKRVALMLARST